MLKKVCQVAMEIDENNQIYREELKFDKKKPKS